MGTEAYNPTRVIQAARHLLADAATRSTVADRADDENIHEIRKDLKKVRAYWRLMRYALGKRHSKAGNERCKQAARQLAGARDQVVMLGTLEGLGEEAGGKTAFAAGQARQAMHEVADGVALRGIEWDRVRDLIRNDDAAWSGLEGGCIDAADIKRGWKRTCRKAKKHYRASRKKPDAPTLHAWRKWAKRWLQQEELLHPGKAGRIDRLDRLGDLLGRHHDLAVLSQRLWRNDHFGGKPQKRVRKAIRQQQAGLQKQAMKLGRKAFS